MGVFLRSEAIRPDGCAGLQCLESPTPRLWPTLAPAKSAGNLGLVRRSVERLS